VLSIVLICVVFAAFNGEPQNQKLSEKDDPRIPLQFGGWIPISIQSDGVEWKGYVYHLVTLGSIRFVLEPKTDRLSAEIQAGLTTFDDVDYDISGAVFDSAGQMLGVARADCQVQREWLGKVLQTRQTINLDFGRSLDYAHATSFMLTVSKRKVLTPDDWQKSK
jgi:hypothetical protein